MPIIAGNLAILAMPKTGTSWCLASLEAAGLKPHVPMQENGESTRHLDIENSRKHIGGRTTMAIVRDPLDWMRSIYLHMVRIGWGPFQGPAGRLAELEGKSFQAFVESYLHRMPGEVTSIYMAYTGVPHVNGVDLLARTENIRHDLCSAVIEAGEGMRCNFQVIRAMKPVNVTKTDKAVVWPRELADGFMTTEHPLFARFGYRGSKTTAEAKA